MTHIIAATWHTSRFHASSRLLPRASVATRRLHTRIILLCVIASCGASVGAQSLAQEKRAWSFAKANVNKFAREARPVAGLAAGSILTFESHRELSLIEYDASSGAFVSMYVTHGREQVDDQCKGTGSYVGQNAFGVKVRVQRQTCDFLFIEDSTKPPFESGDVTCSHRYKHDPVECRRFGDVQIRIPMTTSQFRTAKQEGLKYEVDFEIGATEPSELVTYDAYKSDATITSPFETTNRVALVTLRAFVCKHIRMIYLLVSTQTRNP